MRRNLNRVFTLPKKAEKSPYRYESYKEWKIPKELHNQAISWYKMLSVAETGRKGKEKWMKEFGGKERGSPYYFAWTRYGKIWGYAFELSWKPKFLKELVKVGLLEEFAKIVVENLYLKTKSGHIVFEWLEIPDEMLKFSPFKTDMGVTVKIDKSQGRSEMEIEIDRKIWDEFDDIKNMMDKMLKRQSQLSYEGKITREEIKDLSKRVFQVWSGDLFTVEEADFLDAMWDEFHYWLFQLESQESAKDYDEKKKDNISKWPKWKQLELISRLQEKENRIKGEIAKIDLEEMRKMLEEGKDLRTTIVIADIDKTLSRFDICYDWLFDDKKKQLMME